MNLTFNPATIDALWSKSPSGILLPRMPFEGMTSNCSAQPIPEVTIESIRKIMEELEPPLPPPPTFRVLKMPMVPVRFQCRTHAKKRMNKKWAKRYGFSSRMEERPWFDKDTVIHDKTTGVVTGYPEAIERVKKAMVDKLDYRFMASAL
jgi:hypothetical protein